MLSQVKVHPKNDDVLFSQNSSDDAGVFKLTDDIALIQTVDYFTPIVDDPYTFGEIAAANAMSDVYAMGGEVKTALNITNFSVKKYGADMLSFILQGAEDKVHEAGGSIIGGHSIDDLEPKFGMAVTGIAHPDKVLTNTSSQVGDLLVLTKPIGGGIITTAVKKGFAPEHISNEAIYWMKELNKKAASFLHECNAHAVTDVTGFGLLGHALEMARGSNKTFTIFNEQVPVIKGTSELAEKGAIPGGSKENLKWLESSISFSNEITEIQRVILADAITSGGLLVSLPAEQAKSYVEKLNATGSLGAKVIGEVSEQQPYPIYVN